MKKLTKAQVKSLVKKQEEGSVVTIGLFPSKCGPANTTWVQPYEIAVYHDDNELYVDLENEMSETFDQVINNFAYYNCNNELGNRVHYYLKED